MIIDEKIDESNGIKIRWPLGSSRFKSGLRYSPCLLPRRTHLRSLAGFPMGFGKLKTLEFNV